MKNNFRYTLSKTSKKEACPSCGKKSFTHYVDTHDNNKILNNEIGMCDRRDKCSYHVNPYKIGWGKENYVKNLIPPVVSVRQKSERVHLPLFCLKEERKISTLETSLYEIFDKELVKSVFDKYHVSAYLKYTLFYYIDLERNARAGQCRSYNSEMRGTKTTFIHKLIQFENNIEYDNQELKIDCFFGEHLLNDISNYDFIVVVESPKTSLICSLLFQNILFLSSFNLQGLSSYKLNKLKDLDKLVFFIPDSSISNTASDLWLKQIIKFNNDNFILIDLIDMLATTEEKKNGCDVADYVLNNDDFVIESIFRQCFFRYNE